MSALCVAYRICPRAQALSPTAAAKATAIRNGTISDARRARPAARSAPQGPSRRAAISRCDALKTKLGVTSILPLRSRWRPRPPARFAFHVDANKSPSDAIFRAQRASRAPAGPSVRRRVRQPSRREPRNLRAVCSACHGLQLRATSRRRPAIRARQNTCHLRAPSCLPSRRSTRCRSASSGKRSYEEMMDAEGIEVVHVPSRRRGPPGRRRRARHARHRLQATWSSDSPLRSTATSGARCSATLSARRSPSADVRHRRWSRRPTPSLGRRPLVV